MDTQQAALLQAALVGISLPATRSELIAYLRAEEPSLVPELMRIPDGEYDRIDAVAEALLGLQPHTTMERPVPKAESGAPPGREAYLDPQAAGGDEPNAVRR